MGADDTGLDRLRFQIDLKLLRSIIWVLGLNHLIIRRGER